MTMTDQDRHPAVAGNSARPRRAEARSAKRGRGPENAGNSVMGRSPAGKRLAGFAILLRRLAVALAAMMLFLLTLAPIASQAAEQLPSAFLHDIYKQYIGAGTPGVKLDGDADYKRYFTPGLANIIIADNAKANQVGDVPTLDGDPFIDAQDWSITGIKIAVDDKATDKAIAKVSFKNNGEAETVTLDLVKVDGAWKIDDIHWPEDSLRGIYKE
jgi:hypothetical protein